MTLEVSQRCLTRKLCPNQVEHCSEKLSSIKGFRLGGARVVELPMVGSGDHIFGGFPRPPFHPSTANVTALLPSFQSDLAPCAQACGGRGNAGHSLYFFS